MYVQRLHVAISGGILGAKERNSKQLQLVKPSSLLTVQPLNWS